MSRSGLTTWTQGELAGTAPSAKAAQAKRDAEGLRPKVPQKGLDGLALFDPDARPQPQLFDPTGGTP